MRDFHKAIKSTKSSPFQDSSTLLQYKVFCFVGKEMVRGAPQSLTTKSHQASLPLDPKSVKKQFLDKKQSSCKHWPICPLLLQLCTATTITIHFFPFLFNFVLWTLGCSCRFALRRRDGNKIRTNYV